MSSKNIDKKIIISSKKDKNPQTNSKNISPYVKDKNNSNIVEKKIMNSNQLYKNISGNKKFLSPTNVKFQYHYPKLSNNIGLNNSYMFPISNSNVSILTDSNIFDNSFINKSLNDLFNKNKNKPKVKGQKNNISLHEIKSTKSKTSKSNIKNMNLSPNVNSSFYATKNNILNNMSYNSEQFDPKYNLKINKIKDDYIDFLQKEFEDHTKNKARIDSNNKELLKKCDDLLHDNQILSNTLNDRNNRLSKIIQENLAVKAELDKSILNNKKNEQKISFYEEQFNLYKTNNDNYQKIIKELKEEIEQLNINLNEAEKEKKENQKLAEQKMKEEIENTKKTMEEMFMSKKKEDGELIEKKTQVLVEQIKLLQEKNEELLKDLTDKEHMFELVCKENEKITHENNLFRNQVNQYTRQITELNTIIKHKDNMINNLKSETLNNDKFLNKSSSYSTVKYDGSEYINENISKLITDNEENKMRIELLNNKMKSIDEIEKKYNELMSSNKTLTLTEKLAAHINNNNNNNNKSPKKSINHFNYNSQNNIKNSTYQKSSSKYKKYQNLMSPKKLEMHVGEINSILNSPDLFKTKYKKTKLNVIKDRNPLSMSTHAITKTKDNNIFISNNMSQSRIDKNNTRQKKISENINKNVEHKNTVDREIKVNSKQDKSNSKNKKNEGKEVQIKARYYVKKDGENKGVQIKSKKNLHGKKLQIDKDEIKESLKELERKKNFTLVSKINNYSFDEKEYQQKQYEAQNTIDKNNEQKKKFSKIYYLFGIDRNDCLHIFNINEKRWLEAKKILEIELDDKSNTFRKDYQYEGTLLYNTLYGVYILTGEKTDTLYYYDSALNKIKKICKFNSSHDNGSIMYDTFGNCLYVFGGKKIRACEYYSFNDKKVYRIPDLIYDRANASFIVSNNKIFGFFGFSYSKDTYSQSIEYIDMIKKDKWFELKNIQLLKEDISFDTESISTMYYRQNQSQILIYCGIQGDNEDFVTEYYLLYNVKNNTMDKINKWNMQQYKNIGKVWKNYDFKINDPKGFHFAKNSRFLMLPKSGNYEGYNEKESIDIMIDYKNNIHYILQNKEKIDIYRSDL